MDELLLAAWLYLVTVLSLAILGRELLNWIWAKLWPAVQQLALEPSPLSSPCGVPKPSPAPKPKSQLRQRGGKRIGAVEHDEDAWIFVP